MDWSPVQVLVKMLVDEVVKKNETIGVFSHEVVVGGVDASAE